MIQASGWGGGGGVGVFRRRGWRSFWKYGKAILEPSRLENAIGGPLDDGHFILAVTGPNDQSPAARMVYSQWMGCV